MRRHVARPRAKGSIEQSVTRAKRPPRRVVRATRRGGFNVACYRSVLPEAPDGADVEDVDVALAAGVAAADLPLALPLAAQAERRHHVELQAAAVGPAVIRVGAAGGEVGRVLALGMVAAELCVDA